MTDKDKKVDVVRAWKDEEYLQSLTPEQLKDLPPNPAGKVELTDEDLENINGGVIARALPTKSSGRC